MNYHLLQYIKAPRTSSQKIIKHVRKLVTEPHRIRAYFFYLTHPQYTLFTPNTTRYLHTYLKPGMKVFEWGAGRSTVFFAKHDVELTTIEDNAKWHQKVSQKLSMQGFRRFEMKLVTNEQKYIHAIDTYQDNYFDVVAVDGRERSDCLLTAIPKVKKNGLLILDDSQRERYLPVVNELNRRGWKVTHYPYGFNRTSVWTKPAAAG